MPIQAQIRASSMSSTGLSDESVVTSWGWGRVSGMALMRWLRAWWMAVNSASRRLTRSATGGRSAFQYRAERLTL